MVPVDDEDLDLEVKKIEEKENLLKEIALHLKEYDTAPLNCTVSFMSQKLERNTHEVYKGVQELLDNGIIVPWERWQKGAITPYKLSSLSKLIDRGIPFSYEEMRELTEPGGGTHQNAAMTAVRSGVGGEGRNYLISLPAEELLEEISRRISLLNLMSEISPKREGDPEERSDSLAKDFEFSYLYHFYRSLFRVGDVDPLYAIYSKKGEDLSDFRRRTLTGIIRSLNRISQKLIDIKKDRNQEPIQQEYLFFYASMLDRYLNLSEETDVSKRETQRLRTLWREILKDLGEEIVQGN